METAKQIEMYRKTFKDILSNKALTGANLRALLYLHSIMAFGETRHIVLADMVDAIKVSEGTVVSRALAVLASFGYIEKWREGNDLYVTLLVEE